MAPKRKAPANVQFTGAQGDAIDTQGIAPGAGAAIAGTSIILFRGAYSADPVGAFPCTLGDIPDLLKHTAPIKEYLPLMGPYTLRPGTTRADANVQTGTLLVLDVDDGTSPDALAERLAGTEALLYASPSDTPEHRKTRVIVQPDRPIRPEEMRQARAALAESLGLAPGCGVERAITESHGFFIGRLEGTPEREHRLLEGSPLCVDDLLSMPLKHEWRAGSPHKGEQQAAAMVPSDLPEMSADTLAIRDLIGESRWLEGDRVSFWLELAGYLNGKGIDKGQLGAMLESLDTNEPSRAKKREHRRLLERALPLSGPSAEVRRWLGEDFQKVNAIVNRTALDVDRLHALISAQGPTGQELADEAAWAGTFEVKDRSRLPEPREYIVPELELSPGRISTIQGFSNAGKTPFMLQLAICIAAGRPFLDCEVKQAPVLYIDGEGWELTEEREARICAGLGLERSAVPLTLAALKGPATDEIELAAKVEALARHTQAKVIFIDTYAAMVPGHVEQNSAQFSVLARVLGFVASRLKVMIVVAIHEGKTAGRGLKGISGHGSLTGAVQASIALERVGDQDHVFKVACARGIRKPFKSFEVQWQESPDPSLPEGTTLVGVRKIRKPGETIAAADITPAQAERKRTNEERKAEAQEECARAATNLVTALWAGARYSGLRAATDAGLGSSKGVRKAVELLRAAGIIAPGAGIQLTELNQGDLSAPPPTALLERTVAAAQGKLTMLATARARATAPA